MINGLLLYDLIEENDLDKIEQFLLSNDIDTTDDEFSTLLHYAVIEQKTDIIDVLLKNSANKDALNIRGLTPVQYAAMGDNLQILKRMVITNEYEGLHLMHLAVATGKIHNVTYLIDVGYSVNALDHSLRTPLHWAVQEGQLSIIERLYNNGAILDVVDGDGASPLYIAASENNSSIVNYLINQNVNVELNTGISPLMIACAYSNDDIVLALLNAGANINFRDEEGRTPLFYARLTEDEEMMDLLISKGATTNIVDNNGISILDLDNLEIRSKLYQEVYE